MKNFRPARKNWVATMSRSSGNRPPERAADAWAAVPADDVDDLNVVAVRYLPDDRIGQVSPDEVFDHDGQITKQTVRAVTLAARTGRQPFFRSFFAFQELRQAQHHYGDLRLLSGLYRLGKIVLIVAEQIAASRVSYFRFRRDHRPDTGQH